MEVSNLKNNLKNTNLVYALALLAIMSIVMKTSGELGSKLDSSSESFIIVSSMLDLLIKIILVAFISMAIKYWIDKS
jgi:hypothetical protein